MPEASSTNGDKSPSLARSDTPSGLSSLPSSSRAYSIVGIAGLVGVAVFIGVLLAIGVIPREQWMYAVGAMILCLQPVDVTGVIVKGIARKFLGKS